MSLNLNQIEKEQVLAIAQSIISLEQAEGWKNFVKAAETLANNHIGDHREFDDAKATVIASKVAFSSGIRACLNLIKQQKDIINSLSKEQ